MLAQNEKTGGGMPNGTPDGRGGASIDGSSLQDALQRLDEMRRQVEAKDEEVKMYRGRYEETNKQVEQLVRSSAHIPYRSAHNLVAPPITL